MSILQGLNWLILESPSDQGEKAYTQAKTFNEYYISRGVDVLNPGGLLVLLAGACPYEGEKRFLQDKMTPAKKRIKEKAVLVDAYGCPLGVFKQAPKINPEIIVLRKK